MNDKVPLIFYASGTPGYSAALRDAPHVVRARKRAFAVQLRFTDEDCAVRTLEGDVMAKAGDAIVTGLAGEQWPVARDHVAAKYCPIAPCENGADGMYMSLPIEVIALAMKCPFTVVMRDGHSQLSGKAGDWLVDYGDGSLGIVAANLFNASYETKEID